MNVRTLGSLPGGVFSHKGPSSNAKIAAAVQLVTAAMVLLFWSPQINAYQQDKGDFAFLDWQLAQLTQAITKNPVTPLSAPKAVRGKAAQGGMSPADYKRDVEQAADLQFRKGQVASRYLNKEIDAVTYDKSMKVLDAILTPLNGKWQAAGRGNEFQRDYMQQVRVLAVAHQSQPQLWLSPSGNLFGYTVVALLLLALGLAREIRLFGLDEADPFKIRSGWSTYEVYSSTGTVLSPTKSRVVTTHVSGGGDQPVSTSTSTSIHDQFFIREHNGFERAVQLTDVNVALREGHQVSAVWGTRKGQKSEHYFLVRNHSTRNVDFVKSGVKTMLRPHDWLVLPLLFISLVAGFNFLPVNTCVSCFLGKTPLSKTPWGQGSLEQRTAALGPYYHMLWMTVGLLLAIVVAVLVGFFIATAIVGYLRFRRFKRQIADMLLPILDKRATEQIARPSEATLTPG